MCDVADKGRECWPEALIVRSDTQCPKTLRPPAVSSRHPSPAAVLQVDSCRVHGCASARRLVLGLMWALKARGQLLAACPQHRVKGFGTVEI